MNERQLDQAHQSLYDLQLLLEDVAKAERIDDAKFTYMLDVGRAISKNVGEDGDAWARYWRMYVLFRKSESDITRALNGAGARFL